MMTILDILIYVVFAFCASSLAKKSENYIHDNDIEPRHWDKYLTFFVLFLAIIGGVRWNVGSDCLSYANWFAHERPLNEIQEDKELLWWWFVDVILKSGFHWSIGLGLCTFIQVWFITRTVQPYRWLLVFIPFVFFGGRYWMDTMGAVRQMIVSCMFLWASRFIYSREVWKYVLTISAGVMIHQSALILLPFYFIPLKIDITKHRVILMSIFLACFVLGLTPAFQWVLKYFQFIAGTTNYEGYATAMGDMLLSGETSEALKFGPMMLSYLLIPIFIIWFGPELKAKYSERIPCFNVWYNLAYFYACAYFLVCNISHLFIRPTLYFSLFQMVMASLLLYHLCHEYSKYGVRQVVTIAFCCIIATNTVWDVTKASGLPWETTTYKFFFFHTEQAKRLGL